MTTDESRMPKCKIFWGLRRCFSSPSSSSSFVFPFHPRHWSAKWTWSVDRRFVAASSSSRSIRRFSFGVESWRCWNLFLFFAFDDWHCRRQQRQKLGIQFLKKKVLRLLNSLCVSCACVCRRGFTLFFFKQKNIILKREFVRVLVVCCNFSFCRYPPILLLIPIPSHSSSLSSSICKYNFVCALKRRESLDYWCRWCLPVRRRRRQSTAELFSRRCRRCSTVNGMWRSACHNNHLVRIRFAVF